MSRIGGALGTFVSAVANLFLVLFAGLYIAAQPRLYHDGFLKLVPPQERDRIGATLVRCGRALRNWLLGQAIAMVMVGVLTWAGLALLGVPSALALGLFAGLAEFVPILGPIAAAIPALIIALSQDTKVALWVLALFVVIQQIEGNLLQPIIQRKMVALPPAITLFAVLAFAILFGVMGALLAAPLAVVTLVVVQDLYVETIEKLPGGGSDPVRTRLHGGGRGCGHRVAVIAPPAHWRGRYAQRRLRPLPRPLRPLAHPARPARRRAGRVPGSRANRAAPCATLDCANKPA